MGVKKMKALIPVAVATAAWLMTMVIAVTGWRALFYFSLAISAAITCFVMVRLDGDRGEAQVASLPQLHRTATGN